MHAAQTRTSLPCKPVVAGSLSRQGTGVAPCAAERIAKPFLSSVQQRQFSKQITSASANAAQVLDGAIADVLQGEPEQTYLATRTQYVNQFFPDSLEIADFVHRLETALYQYGFTGANTIACTNMCRDEITAPLKAKIDLVFGNSFNINGLGGVITAGVIGMGAGLSHSPIVGEKERYVFFAFPHIAVSLSHEPGVLRRPNRAGNSSACGALCAALGHVKSNMDAKKSGTHDPENPEYTIFYERIQNQLKKEGKSKADIEKLDLVQITKIADRAIAGDLEFLISKAVDTKKADYAVFTGVQIHSWGKDYEDSDPNLEYVQITNSYAVVNGQKKPIDLQSIPPLTPRQTRELAIARGAWAGVAEDDASRASSAAASAANVTGANANLESFYPSAEGRALKERAQYFRDLLTHLRESNGV